VLIIRNSRAAGGRLLALVITAVLTLMNFEAVAAARTQVVRYDSAVLEYPVAAQKFYVRLRLAAKRVCRQDTDKTSNGNGAAACEATAMTDAVIRVNHASITAIHRARTNRDDARYNAWLMAPTPCAQCG
jgi:UrcA family protein